MASMLAVPIRLAQMVIDEGGARVLGIVIPGVGKVPEGSSRVFPCTDLLVCSCHGVNRFRHHGSRSLSDLNSTGSRVRDGFGFVPLCVGQEIAIYHPLGLAASSNTCL